MAKYTDLGAVVYNKLCPSQDRGEQLFGIVFSMELQVIEYYSVECKHFNQMY